jgi:replicative DNA helicase
MSNALIPPHSFDAEKGVLGSILIDSQALMTISSLLSPVDFYDPLHAKIFDAMLDLFMHNRPIDLLTLKELLENRSILEEIWGQAYLIQLSESVYMSANIYEYAQIVKTKAVLRRLIKAGNDILLSGYDEASELNILLEKAEQSLFSVTQTFIQNRLVHIKDILNLRYEEIAAIHDNPNLATDGRIYMWYSWLDNMLGGLKAGDMVIIAARPSMGKTAIALNFAQNIAREQKTVAIFSLEMSKEQITDRLLCAAMGVDSWKMQKGRLENEEFSKIGPALEKLSQSNIFIDDSPMGNLLEIKSKARRLKMDSWLHCIIIDYLQLMSSGNSMNRVQEISDISRWIKSLARELGIPVIALSQLSRAVESRLTKEPILSDLRESWSIEQDADVVMMLYRDEYYNETTEKQGITTIFVRKNRNGPVWQADLKFEKKYQKFYDIDNQHGEGMVYI